MNNLDMKLRAQPQADHSESRRSILLIDDDPDIRKITEIALRKLGGWAIVTAGSGDEGVRSAIAAQPNLILLDVNMPNRDGMSVFRELRSLHATAHIPVAFLTAQTQQAAVDALMQLGAVAVFEKPFDPVQLVTQIRGILANRCAPPTKS